VPIITRMAPATSEDTSAAASLSISGSCGSLPLLLLSITSPHYRRSWRLHELTFDGTLADATGNGHTATNAGSGSVTFVPTPNQSAFAYPKFLKRAVLGENSTSLRAGNDNQLDGTTELLSRRQHFGRLLLLESVGGTDDHRLD